jgi:hypothetical protein
LRAPYYSFPWVSIIFIEEISEKFNLEGFISG